MNVLHMSGEKREHFTNCNVHLPTITYPAPLPPPWPPAPSAPHAFHHSRQWEKKECTVTYLQLVEAHLAVIPLSADLVYKAMQVAVPRAAHIRHLGLHQAALYQCLQEGHMHQYGKLQASISLAFKAVRQPCHTAQSIITSCVGCCLPVPIRSRQYVSLVPIPPIHPV